MNVILNTSDDIEFAINIMHPMTNKDYDLDEMFSLILTALRNRMYYPGSLKEVFRIGDDEDTKLYNKAIELMYKSIYRNLTVHNLYEVDGSLNCQSFILNGYNLVISTEYITEPPNT